MDTRVDRRASVLARTPAPGFIPSTPQPTPSLRTLATRVHGAGLPASLRRVSPQRVYQPRRYTTGEFIACCDFRYSDPEPTREQWESYRQYAVRLHKPGGVAV